MMIKRLLFVQRIGLKLLILSLFTFPVILSSEDKDEGLELPEVIIYGTYLGKIQFSPKKDFYPYISQGNLFPLARVFSPEIRFPSHKKITGQVETITSHWLLLDSGAGNWWADKVFLDCGLRNEMGFLSLRFTDFRRKGWEEEHSVNKDFFKIKGALNKENSYVSGNIFYNYDKIIADDTSLVDTVTAHIVGLGLFSLFEVKPISFSIFSEFSINHFEKHCAAWWMWDDMGWWDIEYETIQEKIYKNSLTYNIPFEYIDIYGNIYLEGAEKSSFYSGERREKTVTSLDLLLKKTFNGLFTVSPGVRVFIEWKNFNAAPLISLKTMVPNYEIYPFISYFERYRINTITDFNQRCPFIVNIAHGNYSVLKERNITGGFEGRWQRVSYRFSYSHIEYDNYPVIRDSFQIDTIETRKDVLKTNIGLNLNDLSFDFKGSYTPRERIPYEPMAEVSLETKYKRFFPITLLGSLNTLFGIETANKTIDVALLNSGVEWEFLRNTALRFEVENMFDRRYEIWDGYTEGGIQFYLSLKYKTFN